MLTILLLCDYDLCYDVQWGEIQIGTLTIMYVSMVNFICAMSGLEKLYQVILFIVFLYLLLSYLICVFSISWSDNDMDNPAERYTGVM